MRLLQGTRVVEAGRGIAAGYCSKLLADAGADVVKVEPPTGDPLRAWSASGCPRTGRGALFDYLHAGQRSMTLTLDSVVGDDLLEGADILIETGDRPIDIPSVHRRFPKLSVVSITPFGRTGPWSMRAATEFTLQAWSASMSMRGDPARAPVQVGGRVGEWIGGTYAAVAALASLRLSRACGVGEHADLSLLECMAVSMHAATIHWLASTAIQSTRRTLEVPSIELTADGAYVGLSVITGQQYRDLLVLIDRPDLAEQWDASPGSRQHHRDELRDLVRQWVGRHGTLEVLERADLLRIPASQVGEPETIPHSEDAAARRRFVEDHSHRFLQPVPPYSVDAIVWPPPGAAPRLGEADGREVWSSRPQPAVAAVVAPGGRLPLQGVRIVDLTAFLAGPACTHVLAALGADVVKVESVQRPDPMRYFSDRRSSEPLWWEWGTTFSYVNTNKRGITLDLSHQEGRAVLTRLLRESDVLIDNFTPRVMDGFGLAWPVVREANPRLTMVRMPAFGLSGPWRDRPGYAYTIEQVAGMAWMTGYGDGPPMAPGGPADLLGGLHAAFATMAALEGGRGKGHLVEVPMVDVALNVAAEVVIEKSAYGATLVREGNRGPAAAPQGVYRCDGPDTWMALAVETDAQWRSLRQVLGDPSWAASPELAKFSGRRAAHDAIDRELSGWCSTGSAAHLVEVLARAGVPAAVVVLPEEIAANPQLVARGFLETVKHPVTGVKQLAGLPFRSSSCRQGWIRVAAPTLGQHNDEVLKAVIGLSDDEIGKLSADGVVGTSPAGL
jgi:crotonobetainyl-CoA:carnitine CoA-transferase CaiB-like acyl-CoA transferase